MLMIGVPSDLYLVHFVSRASLIFTSKPVVNLKIWQQKYKEVRQAVTQIRFILPLIQPRERNKQLQ